VHPALHGEDVVLAVAWRCPPRVRTRDEAAARVQAAEAKATQVLADNDQRIAAVKREMAVAEAAREEALAEAAAARDAIAQVEDEVVPALKRAWPASENAWNRNASLIPRRSPTRPRTRSAPSRRSARKPTPRVAAAEERTKKAREAARAAEQAAASPPLNRSPYRGNCRRRASGSDCNDDGLSAPRPAKRGACPPTLLTRPG